MPLVTRVFASSEHAWDPMASSSVNFCQKTRTVPVHEYQIDASEVVHDSSTELPALLISGEFT
jgi:hypothetical protein